MNFYMVKARTPNVTVKDTIIGPDDGWVFTAGVNLADIPASNFSIKKPTHQPNERCPDCKDTLILNIVQSGMQIVCYSCGYEPPWVYARYRIVWRG